METTVKFDCSLEFPPIVEPLWGASPDEADSGLVLEQQQTKVTGILAPLIKLNNTTINWSQVKSMTLKCERWPEIQLEVVDSLNLSKTYDKPDQDNILQVQILPTFDNAYRKINLIFTIDDLQFYDGLIYVSGRYNVPGWNDNVMKSYGNISTYEFFETVAKELKLGFASNMDGSDDNRWIYVANDSRKSTLSNECEFGGRPELIMDWWVDFWNCINLVDIYERYHAVDKDIKVWIQQNRYPETETNSEVEPSQVEAMISNHPNFKSSPLFCTGMEIMSDFAKNTVYGSDKRLEIYDMDNAETDSLIVADGSIKKNVILTYRYLGEKFGDVDYLTNKALHGAYVQKLNSQQLKVTLQVPCFGFVKGGKLNFYWYEVNELTKDIKNKELGSNIDLPIDVTQEDQDQPLIDGQLSGQYYITDVSYYYENRGNVPMWTQEMLLSRPVEQVEKYVTEEDRPIDPSSFGKPAELPKTENATDEGFLGKMSSFMDEVSEIVKNMKEQNG